MLAPAFVETALGLYGLHGVTHGAVTGGYRNISHAVTALDGRQLNLIVYKDEPKIEQLVRRTNALGLHLHRHGLPVRYPVDERIIVLRGGRGGRLASLYNYLPGETIPWEAYTKRHIKLLGMALADMHRASLQMRHDDVFSRVSDVYRHAVRRMNDYFSQAGVRSATKAKLHVRVDEALLSRLDAFLRACDGLPDQQILHMDFVRGNVLFRRAQPDDRYQEAELALSGIIDLEKAAIGHPLMDVARTLAFLLVDCSTKPQAKIYKYLIDSGYRKRGQMQLRPVNMRLAGRHYDLLEQSIDLYLLHDFYKFLSQNPYESLADNYHYVRTRDRLIARGMLQSI